MLKILTITCLLLSPYSLSYASNSTPANEIVEPDTLFSEAMAYLLGRHGKEKSSEVAFKKFEQLASQGWKTAQHMLGNMYAKGEGTEKDLIQAYLWYSLASNQNFSIATLKAQDIRQQLQKNEIQQAEILIKEWSNNSKSL